jgi:hypothetical protein
MVSDTGDEKPARGRPLWLLVPAIAGIGLAMEYLQLRYLPAPVPLIGSLTPGMLGCVVASFVLAILALRSTKKDIVSICVPFISLYMFVIFPESGIAFLWQAIFAVSLSILAVRFGLWYNQ